jgi:hypothetical protein
MDLESRESIIEWHNSTIKNSRVPARAGRYIEGERNKRGQHGTDGEERRIEEESLCQF